MSLLHESVQRSVRPALVPRRWHWRTWQDRVGHWAMASLAWAIIGLLVAITGVLVLRAGGLLQVYPLSAIVFGVQWQPLRGTFGMAPFFVGTLLVTAVAMLLAVPLAILSGIYLAEYTRPRTRLLLKPLTDLLAGMPPVVYGVWGVLVIVPLVRDVIAPISTGTIGMLVPFLSNPRSSGYSVMAAGLVLSLMIFPIITAITEEVLRAVPRELREAAFALGATRWEVSQITAFRAGLPGIIAAVVLGFSRAFGETLAVLMVVGNIPRIPPTLFDGSYTLSGLIANNYGEMMSVPLYERALMTAALALLAVVISFNVGTWLFLTRRLQIGGSQ
ncbi:MAG: phosphate ABC transporter permease subunit PstC [Chloroflexaceae bacterium]|nr:phosphate ABC transporter permease subunit PstC [Chloroflexaceae bacterium]